MIVKGYRLGPLFKKTASEVMDDNVLGLAAQLAYYFFFSLFPIFLFLAPMLALVGDKKALLYTILQQAARTVPSDAFALVEGVVRTVVFSEGAPGIVSIGAALALYSGSSIFSNLMTALNTAYDCDGDSRPWWKRQLIAMASLICIGFMFVLATIVFIAGGDIVDKLSWDPLESTCRHASLSIL